MEEERAQIVDPALITLRPIDPSTDLDAFYTWASDGEVARFCSWNVFTSKSDLLDHIHAVVLPHPWFRVICLAGRVVGVVHLILLEPHRAELGYVVAREHWGRGIATVAARMAVAEGFAEMPGLVRVEGLAEVDNPASQRVLEKAGFTREGVLRSYWMLKDRARDMVMFSYISERLNSYWN